MDDSPVSITLYEDGPLIVRGTFELRDQDGHRLDPAPTDSPTRIVALCRCGKSGRKPFCDDTHKTVGFRAPGTAAASLIASVDTDAGRLPPVQ